MDRCTEFLEYCRITHNNYFSVCELVAIIITRWFTLRNSWKVGGFIDFAKLLISLTSVCLSFPADWGCRRWFGCQEFLSFTNNKSQSYDFIAKLKNRFSKIFLIRRRNFTRISLYIISAIIFLKICYKFASVFFDFPQIFQIPEY